MPPKPLYQSSRAQSTAVAVACGLILLIATGLAYLQAGSGLTNTHDANDTHDNRTRQRIRPGTPSRGVMMLDLPNRWTRHEDAPGSLLLTDPDKPTRRIRIITVSLDKPTPPVQVLEDFIKHQPDPSAGRTRRPAVSPSAFSLTDGKLRGAEFIGSSGDDEAQATQRLFACLTADGREYWLIYLSDTLGPDADPAGELRANARLLRAIYQSAHIQYE